MKQVLIKPSGTLSEQTFSQFTLKTDRDISLAPGANWVEVDWPIAPLNSNELRFYFTLDAGLATVGIALAAHYFNNSKPDKIFFVLHNLTGHAVASTKGSPLAAAHAYEPVQIRQVEQDFKDVMVIEPDKKEKPKRQPRAPQKKTPAPSSSSSKD